MTISKNAFEISTEFPLFWPKTRLGRLLQLEVKRPSGLKRYDRDIPRPLTSADQLPLWEELRTQVRHRAESEKCQFRSYRFPKAGCSWEKRRRSISFTSRPELYTAPAPPNDPWCYRSGGCR